MAAIRPIRRDPPAPQPNPRIEEQLYIRTFDPDNEPDQKEICRIKNMALREQAVIYKEERNYNERQGRYHVYLEWSEISVKSPEEYQDVLDDEDFLPELKSPFYDADDMEALRNEERGDDD